MRLLKSLGFPIFLLTVYFLFLILIRAVLPPQDELIEHLSGIYERYGYEMIFIGAFFESLILINFLVPGVVTIGLGAVFARVGELNLGYAILAATGGCLLGYMIDYAVGSLGIEEILKRLSSQDSFEKAQANVEKYAFKSSLVGFIHPNLGAFLSVVIGASRITFKTFIVLAGLSTLFWMSVWGLLIFSFGKLFLIVLTKYVFALAVLIGAGWFLWVLYKNLRK